jgi:hypothetical protein
MALTLRTNGSGGGIVSSGWWNDYYNLLTGSMNDQAVTLSTNLSVIPLTVSTVGRSSSTATVLVLATLTTNPASYNLVIGGGGANGPTLGIVDTQNSGNYIFQGNSLALTITPPTQFTGGLATATAGVALTFKDNVGNIEFDANAPAASARGILFAGVDTSGTLHAGLQVNSDGSMELGAYNTSTSAVQLVKIYTGTVTPTGTIPDGSIWVKA